MGWCPPEVRQKSNQSRLWFRLCRMNNQRLTSKIFSTSYKLAKTGKRNWCKILMSFFDEIHMSHLKDSNTCLEYDVKTILKDIAKKQMQNYETSWLEKLYHENPHTSGRNKLRTYRQFKSNVKPEIYATNYLNRQHRRALAQFRMGTAPLKLETDRYAKNSYIPVSNRLCTFCDLNEVEDVCHALIRCHLYINIRSELFSKVTDFNIDFINKSDTDKLHYLLSNQLWYKDVARSCYFILLNRSDNINVNF